MVSQENEYREMDVDRTLMDHEVRITENERFRLRAEGALTIIGFMLGSGFVVTLLLFVFGVI